MDQVKIGRFIAKCRKKTNLTQMQLAEKLNITDRAVSKWETGKAMPDSSIMLPQAEKAHLYPTCNTRTAPNEILRGCCLVKVIRCYKTA
ncbi:MAG: helix-turn-helix transcriptional regulator [Clostridia bacterium]|nr:helix-turn-helix transcriptional regulator [Clostridia bacterium]